MAIKPALNQFNGGEISPILEGRTDWQKFNYSAKLCKNFIPTVEGSLKRRGGSHFIDIIPELLVKSLNITLYVPDSAVLLPELKVNGVNIAISEVESDEENYSEYKTTTLSFKEGEYVEVSVSGFGVKSTSEVFYMDEDYFKTYTLEEQTSTDVTLTVVKSDENINLSLNGTEDNPYTTSAGAPIVWNAEYNGNTNTGTIYIYEDKTMVLYLQNGVPCLGGATSFEVLEPSSGTIYLDAGRYRVKVVGGGGQGRVVVRANQYGGGSGAFVDAVVNLTTGEYSWQCGQRQESLSSLGTSSYLKSGNTTIVEAGAGTTSFLEPPKGGTASVNNDYIEEIYTKQNGNNGPKAMYVGGASLYGDYGRGGRVVDESPATLEAGTHGYISIQKMEE